MADRFGWGHAFALAAASGLAALAVFVAAQAEGEFEPAVAQDRVDIVVDGASPALADFTDPATGCTYLVHRLGGVTPRLDGAGRPMCRGGR